MKEAISKRANEKIESGCEYGIHITHNDADGLGCGLILDRLSKVPFKTYFCSVDDASSTLIQLLTDDTVIYPYIIISDLSIDENATKILEDYIKMHKSKVLLEDHHQTNILYGVYPWAINCNDWCGYLSDKEISATLGMYILMNTRYDFFINILDEIQIPMGNQLLYISHMISRYDTWLWKTNPIDLYSHKEEYFNIIVKQYGITEAFMRISDLIFSDEWIGLLTEEETISSIERVFGESIFIYKNKRENIINIPENKLARYTKDEYVYMSYISDNIYSNDISEYLYNKYEDADIILVLYPSTCSIGLRTAKNDINVSRIAKRFYNGGGHQKAAGAKLSPREFMDLLELHYYNKLAN